MNHSVKNKMAKALLVYIATVTLIACNEGTSSNLSQDSSLHMSQSTNSNNLNAVDFQKVFTNDALIDDLINHKAECAPKKNKGQHQVCIQICHVPPGNPKAAKSMVIPVVALKAHLEHGHHNEVDRDYLGSCNNDGSEQTDTSNNVDNTTSTDDTSSSTDTNSTTTQAPAPVPTWCEPYLSIDSDCDGIIDSTGFPLF